MKYTNPVIKGFNPDPSVCRVGDDFYLVCSSFEYFPGVPIYHSKNLVNWELVNHCLSTDEQLNLNNCKSSNGIYAPTIRYNNNTFYMTTTNVGAKGHLIVKTDDVLAEWSSPVYVDQEGIDPSLYFENDKVYFTSTCFDLDGKQAIGMCEINIDTGEKLTDTTIISYGTGGKYCEAPHIYKANGFYYLITAEGGTELGHYVAQQRSKNIYGPYEKSPYGVLVSHKDRANTTLQGVGHADIFEDKNGNWWLVCLAFRQLPGTQLHNLGRETCLAPVHFTQDGWFAVENSHIEYEMSAPLPSAQKEKKLDFFDDFKTNELNLEWNFIRNPQRESYTIDGALCLNGSNYSLDDYAPTFVGVRQKEFSLKAIALLSFSGGTGVNGAIGIAAYYSKEYHYELLLVRGENKTKAVLSMTLHNMHVIIKSVDVAHKDEYKLQIKASCKEYEFFIIDEEKEALIGSCATAGLCTEGTMHTSFTGVFIGVFAQGCAMKAREFSVIY